VTLVLRLIRQSRWDSPGRFDWLAEGDIPADPLGDFAGTTANSLSVWLVDDDKKSLPRVVTAMAAGRDKADHLDYALFPHKHLEAGGIEVRESAGKTPDEGVNGHHRNLIQLSAAKVVALTEKVWDEHDEVKRVDKKTVVRLVADAVRGGRIALQELRPKLAEDVRRYLESAGGEPPKPR
jgi:hypothetical protein